MPTSTSRPTSSNASRHPSSLVLGIDPGLAATGWGVLESSTRVAACGTFKTAPGTAGPRLLLLVTELQAVLAAHPVGEAALEELFMGRNASSAIGVAQARGAVLVALTAAGIPVFEYKPSQVKAALTGYGMAGKAQMARMLALQVAAPARLDDHAADAVAIALCHARSRRLRLITEGSVPSPSGGRAREGPGRGQPLPSSGVPYPHPHPASPPSGEETP